MKTKENGLYDYGVIELEPVAKDANSDAQDLTPEQELGKQLFCNGWPALLVYLNYQVGRIKNPIFKFLAKAGLSIIDGVHDATCK